MEYLVSAAEMKRYDSDTIEKLGIPAAVLMERAALSAYACVCKRLAAQEEAGTVLILAGYGNNGADGLALARLLAEQASGHRAEVEVWCVGDAAKATELWKLQRRILENYAVEMSAKPRRTEYTIIVDALFGVGLCRKLEGIYYDAVECLNRLGGFKLALDAPSGIDCDTGSVLGTAVRADETVTFGFCKRGLVLYPGCGYTGALTIAPVGITQKAFFGNEPEWFAYDEPVHALLPGRNPAGHKGSFGKLLLLAGSKGMAGAACLAAEAAYRTGAGMVKVATVEENRVILQGAVPEAMLETGEELSGALDWADIVVAGPGLGTDERAERLLLQVLERADKPLVLDADGLNLLAGEPKLQSLLLGRTNPDIVLTPHIGELSRLTGQPPAELKRSPAYYGKQLAQRLHAVVAVKDARTFICREEGACCVNLTGNDGMATAGSGDVLAGVIGGLLAQGADAFSAACAGAYLHGAAGDRISEKLGGYSCMAWDIASQGISLAIKDNSRACAWEKPGAAYGKCRKMDEKDLCLRAPDTNPLCAKDVRGNGDNNV